MPLLEGEALVGLALLLLLLGDGKGEFKALRTKQSGIDIKGQVRDIVSFNGGKTLLVARNNAELLAYQLQ